MSTPEFRITYRLTGVGWVECDVEYGDRKVRITASYLSDALGQLACAALALRLGAPAAHVSLDEEPGEYRWGFRWHRDPDGSITKMRIRIWWFPEMWGHRLNEEGEVQFDEIIPQEVVYRALLTTLDDVLAQYGETGYAEQWDRYRFPTAVHKELSQLIGDWPGRRKSDISGLS